jgi:hypothetical protein
MNKTLCEILTSRNQFIGLIVYWSGLLRNPTTRSSNDLVGRNLKKTIKSIVVPDPDPSSPFLFSDANVRDVLPQPAHLHTKWIVRPVPKYGN